MEIASSPSDRALHSDFTAATCTEESAYLIVHVDSAERLDSQAQRALTPLRRLWAMCRPAAPGADKPLSLGLTDVHGRNVLSLPNAIPVLGVALVPGTYHLTATRDQTRRRYTVSLPAGARFELHLRFAASEPVQQALPASHWSARSAN